MRRIVFSCSILVASGCAGPTDPTPLPTTELGQDFRAGATGELRDGAPVYRKHVYSPVFTIDRIYPSMTGPGSEDRVVLFQGETPEPELLWLTGYEVDITSPDGEDVLSQEFMCHTNLEMDALFHRRHFPSGFRTSPRVFTLSQGQRRLRLPAGFGIPVRSDQPTSVDTQVLNHNLTGADLRVRHRVAVEFVRDRDLTGKIVPLALQSVFGYVLVEGPDGHFGRPPGESDVDTFGGGCLPGRDVGEEQGSLGSILTDEAGRRVSSHWLVEPGREVNHSRIVETMLDLPFDTTVHYVAAHLHPFAESLELFDLTTDESVYKTRVRAPDDGRIGIAEVESFASAEGFPLYADHQYELISTYNNTSGRRQDSMAVLYLYVRSEPGTAVNR